MVHYQQVRDAWIRLARRTGVAQLRAFAIHIVHRLCLLRTRGLQYSPTQPKRQYIC